MRLRFGRDKTRGAGREGRLILSQASETVNGNRNVKRGHGFLGHFTRFRRLRQVGPALPIGNSGENRVEKTMEVVPRRVPRVVPDPCPGLAGGCRPRRARTGRVRPVAPEPLPAATTPKLIVSLN